MPDQPFTSFQVRVQERKAKQQGIDFPRAYRALIRGFIRVKTTREPRTETTEPEKEQG
ncbi:MAG: hypothetical protein BroJett038_34610 [Chloroflexota bacterium]|nr:MAG: hypothetical protein BroJett038_34610 [Chloroflexota bacterium]